MSQHEITEHLTGVWIGPDNTRVDITHDPAHNRWVASSALGLYTTTFDNADDLRAGIARLEATGSIYQPTITPRPTPATSWTEQWEPRRLIGPLILFILIVAIGIAIIS